MDCTFIALFQPLRHPKVLYTGLSFTHIYTPMVPAAMQGAAHRIGVKYFAKGHNRLGRRWFCTANPSVTGQPAFPVENKTEHTAPKSLKGSVNKKKDKNI